ncbi:MAG: hypothetical protein H8F28_20910, partial [Fibrella sp.]|nr:hypothetical protein [Armatimonadota bacterium]
MSIPFPLNNNPNVPPEDSVRASQLDAPIKPFRAAIAPKKGISIDPKVLRSLYNDNKELKRALVYGLFAVLIIAGSIIAKTGFTYATLAVIVLAIFGLALVDTWNAIFLFFVYLSLEGMYKYTSNFHPVVYIMAPILSSTIFVAWRIRTRGELERKEAKTKTPAKPSLFQRTSGSQEVGLPRIAPWVLALIALSFLQSANPDSPGFINSMNGAIVWYIGPMAFFFIAYFALEHRREAMGFIYTVLVTGFVVSAYAVVQFYLGKEWVDSHVPGMQNMAIFNYTVGEGRAIEGGAYRPPSTAPITGGYVIVSCLAMLAALCIATMPRMVTWRRTLALLSVSVMAMALAVSGVRQVILNLCVVIPILLGLSVRRFEDTIRIYFMIFMLAALLTVSFITADIAAEGKLSRRYGSVFTGNPLENYANNRGNSLGYIPRAIAVRPFGIGIRRGTRGGAEGPGFIRGSDGVQVLNNRETQWNTIHADLGVFGLICLMGFFGTVLYQGARICRTLPDPNLRS